MEISGISPKFNQLYNKTTVEQRKTDEFERLLKKAETTRDTDELKQACQDFEAYFVKTVFKEMRKTLPKTTVKDTSGAKQMYEEMLDDARAKDIAKTDDIGLAKILYEQLKAQAGRR